MWRRGGPRPDIYIHPRRQPRRAEDVGGAGIDHVPRGPGEPGDGTESLPEQSSWARSCPGTSDVGSVRWDRRRGVAGAQRCRGHLPRGLIKAAEGPGEQPGQPAPAPAPAAGPSPGRGPPRPRPAPAGVRPANRATRPGRPLPGSGPPPPPRPPRPAAPGGMEGCGSCLLLPSPTRSRALSTSRLPAGPLPLPLCEVGRIPASARVSQSSLSLAPTSFSVSVVFLLPSVLSAPLCVSVCVCLPGFLRVSPYFYPSLSTCPLSLFTCVSDSPCPLSPRTSAQTASPLPCWFSSLLSDCLLG